MQHRRDRNDPLVGLRLPLELGFLLDEDHAELEADVRPCEVLHLTLPHTGEQDAHEQPALVLVAGRKELLELFRGHEFRQCALWQAEAFDGCDRVDKQIVALDRPVEKSEQYAQLVIDRPRRDPCADSVAAQPSELGPSLLWGSVLGTPREFEPQLLFSCGFLFALRF